MKNEPFIARDTKQPLVVLGGYRIGQGGRIIHEEIAGKPQRPVATYADRELLAAHGMDGLLSRGLHGVIDRLNAE